MSLINDALKRAKQAQRVAPPPPATDLEFRPVERPARQASGNSLMLAATLAVVLLLAVLLIWQMARSGGTQVKATQPAAPGPKELASSQPAANLVAAAPAPAQRQAEPIPEPPTKALAAPESVKAVATTDSADPAATPVEAPPKPAPKLQSIVFHPTRPSAMISGKVLFVGDKFGEWRVAAISQESATLVAAGQTNILILP
jgi:hypothetical protein